ncbi:hypothetical protein [Enterobacter chuandaensis]|uniref:hypothetical protein n=1 Tax=Enterobacter chuandaensis TaxID=2497875 RepID=UPI003AB53ABC
MGPWHLRDTRFVSCNRNGYKSYLHWEFLSSYVERINFSFRSRLTLGKNVTSSDIFD